MFHIYMEPQQLIFFYHCRRKIFTMISWSLKSIQEIQYDLNDFIKQNFGNMEVDGPWITESCIVKTLGHCEESILDIEINASWRFLVHQLHEFLHFWLFFLGDHAVYIRAAVAALEFLDGFYSQKYKCY